MSASPPPAAVRPRAGGKLRPVLVRLAAMLLGLVVPLALAEACLRFFDPVDLHATDTFLMESVNAAHTGVLALRPGAVTRQRTEEFDVAIRINSRGLRDREFPFEKPPGVYRILVLGDSQTFGDGVEEHAAYPKVIERLLGEQVGRPIEVINSGVPGSGTAQQLYFLEEFGWRYQPDLVVLGCFLFNDVGDNGLSRLYAVIDGRLTAQSRVVQEARPLHEVAIWQSEDNDFRVVRPNENRVAAPPQPPFLIRTFHLARWGRERWASVARARKPEVPWHSPRHARELTAKLLEEIDRQCVERNVPFQVVLIPALAELQDPKKQTASDQRDHDLTRLIGADQVLRMAPEFADGDPAQFFYEQDLHLSAAGHRRVAERLVERLRQRFKSSAEQRAR